ncbi:MAG: ComEC/Rec2 family competence protein [Anaerolineales bacterium]|nr:ComEC/Rec2 family competence protein [Anaerolineales bacterium]MCB8951144.1 ComEC/Rec2 family competence protein [Ardenticatenales bacterium]
MIVVYAALAWFVGLVMASLFPFPLPVWLGAVGLAVAGILLSLRRPSIRLPFLVLAAMGLGGARYILSIPAIDTGHVAFYNGTDVVLTGVVNDEPELRDTTLRLDLRVESLTIAGGATRPVSGRVLVNAARFPLIPYGARILVIGRLDEPPVFDTFDYREYLARQGFHSVMLLPEIEVVEENVGNPVYAGILAFKTRAQSIVNRLITDPQAALLNSILLGNRAGLDDAVRADFRRTGMAHVIAISGFHLSILAGMLVGLFTPLVGEKRSPWFVLLGIIFYTIMVGAGASVVRAAIMSSMYLIGTKVLGRPRFAFGSLFAAGVIMTLWRPAILWDVAFQFSFSATLGLMLYADRFSRWARRLLLRRLSARVVNGYVGPVTDLVMVTVAAQVATLPLAMFYFNQIAIVNLVANPLILPALPGLMLSGGLAVIVGLLSPLLAQPIAWLAWLFLSYAIFLVRLLARIPFAALPVQISLTVVVLLYLLIGGVTWIAFQPRPRRENMLNKARPYVNQQIVIGFALLVAILVFAWGRTQPDGHLHVVFFDVGQGSATFIQTPSGRQILVDGGPSPTLLNTALGRMMPFWDRQLDMVISTNMAGSYATGLPGVLERYQVDQLVTGSAADGSELPSTLAAYATLLDVAQGQEVPLHLAAAGEMISVGDGVRLEVLGPSPNTDGDETVSLRLVYDNLTVMLAGAAGTIAEQAMVEADRPMQSLVQLIGRQGGKNATSTGFLRAVHPQVAVISVAGDNRFGDPQQDVLTRIAGIGAPILRTDQLGSIELISDGAAMWWQAWK